MHSTDGFRGVVGFDGVMRRTSRRFRHLRALPVAVLTLLAALSALIVSSPGAAVAGATGSGPTPLAATAIAAGYDHTCALLATGDVRCWGYGASGQLGYGNRSTIGDDETPASAGNVPLGGKATAIAAGYEHTCALLTTGDVRCWGLSGYGQLGYGNTHNIGDDETPATAGNVPLGDKAIAITAGKYHTCALLTTGDVRCWGGGASGQLGYGNRNRIGDDETPATAGNIPLGAKATAIAAGGDHTCALLSTGDVRCWGAGAYGQLGYGNTNNIGDDETPASAGNVQFGGGAIAIAAGEYHTCALLTSGSLRCWGDGANGQLGYGNTHNIGDRDVPLFAGGVPLGAQATAITAGDAHTCAVLTTGDVRCWGSGGNGRLGYGNTTNIGNDETPATTGNITLGAKATAIAAGDSHTCALLTTGGVRCWGYGYYGQLGYGNTNTIGDDETPATAGDVPLGFAATTTQPSASRLTVHTNHRRDRHPAYTWHLTGALTSTDPTSAHVCGGHLTIQVRYQHKTLATRHPALTTTCHYTTNVKITRHRLLRALPRRLRNHPHRRVTLHTTLTWPGNHYLTPTTHHLTLYAR